MASIDLNKLKDLTDIAWNGNIGGSSNGILAKALVEKGNSKIYLKLGSYNIAHGFYGIEPIMELIFSRVGAAMGLSVLEYGLIMAKVVKDNREYITAVSVSKDFKAGLNSLSAEEAYLAFRQGNEQVIDTLKRAGLSIDIYRMFVFDYVICNMDRHGKNFEMLTDGKTVRAAPLFDNSLSVLGIRTDEEIRDKNTVINDNMRVNNFIGTQNLYANLQLIDIPIKVRYLRAEDRAKIFQGLGNMITRGRRDFIWETINRRIENAKRFRFIRWY